MKKYINIFCLGVMCIFLSVASAMGGTQDELLKKVQENYADFKSFGANINQELFHRESNTTQKRTGEILFKKPDNLRWTTLSPVEEILIVNEDEIWNYLPEEELAYRYHPSTMDSSQTAISILTGENKLSDNFEVEAFEDESEKGNDKIKSFLIYPNEPSTQMVEAQIWINTETNLLQKINILDFYGNTNSIEFTDFKPNAKSKNSDFKFKVPKGIDVQDHYDQNLSAPQG